jgi:hypothetical protein
MEFLDPKKQRSHTIRILIGYVLIAIALVLATTILIYQANGFGYKNGQVIQNGLVFMSSLPDAADIYVNGQKIEEQTGSRLRVPAGQYVFELKRPSYRSWQRAINVEGGVVVRFDYPFLVPEKLTTNTVKKYDAQPNLTLQSPDHRWLLVSRPEAFGSFDQFDLDDPEKVASPALLQLPAEAWDDAGSAHKWELVEWSRDNRHVMLKHLYGTDFKQSEYVLVDRQDSAKSVNLTQTLGINPTTIVLRDKTYDQYFIFDANAGNIFTASLKKPTPQIYLEHVLAFKSHGDDRLLYATARDASAGKVLIKEKDGDTIRTLKSVPAGTTYLLDFARYKGNWYVVIGAKSDNRTYVYKNPLEALNRNPDLPLVPVQILKTVDPNYLSFSANARFSMVENGSQMAVYDAETDRGYKYDLKLPVDSSSGHAAWMDGHRMSITSGGKLVIFEFDNANQEQLQAMNGAYEPAFDRDYRYVYGLVPQTTKAADGKETTQFLLTRTALRTAADL